MTGVVSGFTPIETVDRLSILAGTVVLYGKTPLQSNRTFGSDKVGRAPIRDPIIEAHDKILFGNPSGGIETRQELIQPPRR